MSTNVGTLTIEMAANIVRLQQDMDKARKSVEGAMTDIGNYVDIAKKAFVAFAGVASVQAFAGMVKGAIDSAEKLHDLSMVTGASVESLSALVAVGKTTGTTAETIAGAMNKLAKNTATVSEDGKGAAAALRALNIDFNDFQRMTPDQKMIAVAKAMDNFADGSGKSAAAMLLLGKSGADLLPYMKDLAQTGELQAKVTAEQAAAADNFNDNLTRLGVSGKAWVKELAMGMIPALDVATQAFLDIFNSSGGLRDQLKKLVADGSIERWTYAAIEGLSYAADAIEYLWRGIQTIGKGLGAYSAAFMAAARGEWTQAGAILKELGSDLTLTWSEKTLGKQLRDRIADLRNTTKAIEEQKPQVQGLGNVQEEAAKKAQAAYEKLTNSIDGKIAANEAELSLGKKLTPAQQLEVQVLADLTSGELKLTSAQEAEVKARLKKLKATEAAITAQQLEVKVLEESAKENQKWFESMDKSTQKLVEEAEKQREANDTITLGKEAVERLKIEKMRETVVSLERKAALAEEAGLGEEVVNAYRDQAKALRNLAELKEQGIHVQAAKDAADEWKKTTEQIQTSLTDALLRGFESGKDFGKNLADTLINMFKTLVLRPIIQPIAQGASTMLLSALGLGGSTAAAAGQATSSLGMVGTAVSALGQMGSYFATGFMNTIAGTGTAAGLTAGSAVGGASGAAMSIGAIAPWVAGVAALAASWNSLFGREQKDVGVEGALTTGAGITGSQYRFLEGGFFRSDKTVRDALSKEIEAVFDTSIAQIAKQTRGYAVALGLPADEIDKYTKEIKLSFQGLSEQEINQKIADTLAEFQEGIISQYATALEPLQLAGETFTQTIERLMAINNVSLALNEFGGAFATFATSSIAARQNIIELAGGLDQLVQKTQGFIANFYTREEQAGITARGVVQALESAGFTAAQIAALETRQDFRSLLESIDVSTEIGQRQFVTLLDMQQMYSDMLPIMEEQRVSLVELIAAAPQVEMMQKMFEADATYQDRVKTAEEAALALQQQLVDTMGNVDISIQNLSVIMGNGLDRIASATASAIAEANAVAANAIAMAQESSARAAAAEIEAARLAAEVAASAALYDQSAGGFASGGYMTGPALVGEHGPEIFDPQRNQVYTNAATMSMLGGDAVANEVRALREEVAMMRYETRATATNTAKIAKLQDNWDVRGLTVKTDADQPLDTVTA